MTVSTATRLRAQECVDQLEVRDSELVESLVGPIGVPIGEVADTVVDSLAGLDYWAWSGLTDTLLVLIMLLVGWFVVDGFVVVGRPRSVFGS